VMRLQPAPVGFTLAQRLLRRVVLPVEVNGCWRWNGARTAKGYSHLVVAGRNIYAHRAIWVLFNGPISGGLQIDHLCRNRGCVNVDHMEPVTCRTNLLRGEGNAIRAARAARQTHCKQGHPLTPDNLYPPSGTNLRICRRCKLDSWHRWNAKRRIAKW
jgi:hypothetical protein